MTSAQEFKQQGNVAFQSQNFEEAAKLFTAAIACDPSDHVLYSNRSGAYASLKDFTKALEDAEKCIAIKPDWAKGYSRKGLALLSQGKVLEAIEAYQTGLKIDPNNAAIQDALARAQHQAAKPFQEEQLELQIMLTLAKEPKLADYIAEDPDYIKSLTGIVREIGAGSGTGDVQKLQLAMSMAPERIKQGLAKLFNIPMPAESSSEPAAAPKYQSPTTQASESDTARPTMPENANAEAEALKIQGTAAYKAKDFEKALQLYQAAYELDPEEILYLNNKAAVYLEMGEYEKCIKTCTEALEAPRSKKTTFQKMAKVYNRMAACYRKEQRYAEAIQMYQKALCEDNDRHTRAALRECERLQAKAEAESFINPELAEELRLKGNEFFKNKQYPDAKTAYDEAIKRNPADHRLYGNRAATYMQLLEYPSALKDAEKAIEIDPQFVKGWARKGACHLRLKEHNKALEAYQHGLQLDPNNEECRNGLNQTLAAVRATQASSEVDEEQVKKAMSDPEIQAILRDPQFQMILESLQSDPSRLSEYLRDPKVAQGLQKLSVAGILRLQ